LNPGFQCKKYFIDLNKITSYNGVDSLSKIVNSNYVIEIPLLDSTSKIITSIEFRRDFKSRWKAIGFGSSRAFRPINTELLTFIKDHNANIIEVPALNFGFISFRDSTTGLPSNKLIPGYWPLYDSGFDLKDSVVNSLYQDVQLLKILKQQSQTVNSNSPG
ncbi:MAG: hypothetical protein ABIO44_05045, partial [Saprospiraceae bacterium]